MGLFEDREQVVDGARKENLFFLSSPQLQTDLACFAAGGFWC